MENLSYNQRNIVIEPHYVIFKHWCRLIRTFACHISHRGFTMYSQGQNKGPFPNRNFFKIMQYNQRELGGGYQGGPVSAYIQVHCFFV